MGSLTSVLVPDNVVDLKKNMEIILILWALIVLSIKWA